VLALAWASLLIASCTDDATLVGFRKDPRLATRLVEIPLTYGVFLREPISTQNTSEDDLSRLLVGKVSDPGLGNIEAKAFFNFSPPIQTAFPSAFATFESLELQLKFDYYSYGTPDSSDLQLNVFEVEEPMTADRVYLSGTQIAIGASPIGDTVITPGPAELKEGWSRYIDNDPTNNSFFTVTIKLSGPMGQNILNDLVNDRLIFEDFVAFSSKYPGFAVTMPSGNKILGFTPVYSLPTPTGVDSKVILKYKESGTTVVVDFPIYYSSINGTLNPVVTFSFVESDRSTGPLNGIIPFQDFVPADNQMYVQSGLGIMAKFELAKVYEYFDTIENVVINSAEMVFENTSSARPPQQFELLLLDSVNQFRGLYLDTLIAGETIRINDPYLIKIQQGIVPLGISADEIRLAILNELTGQAASIDQTTGKIGSTVMTEFFQQIIVNKKSKRRAKAFAFHPQENEFEKTVSSLRLDPSSAKVKIYYSKPLTSLP